MINMINNGSKEGRGSLVLDDNKSIFASFFESQVHRKFVS